MREKKLKEVGKKPEFEGEVGKKPEFEGEVGKKPEVSFNGN